MNTNDHLRRICQAIEYQASPGIDLSEGAGAAGLLNMAAEGRRHLENLPTVQTHPLTIWHGSIDGRGGTGSHAALSEAEIEDWLLDDAEEDRESLNAWLAERLADLNIIDFLQDHFDEYTTFNIDSTVLNIPFPPQVDDRELAAAVEQAEADFLPPPFVGEEGDDLTEDTIGYLVRDALVLLDEVAGASVNPLRPQLVTFVTGDGAAWRAALSREV